MPIKKEIPTGWTKGEQLLVRKDKIGESIAWIIERPISFNVDDEVSPDDIACIWFYSLEEFGDFMKWWF
jgi:hypothetical protein